MPLLYHRKPYQNLNKKQGYTVVRPCLAPPTHPIRNKTHGIMSFHLTSPPTPLPLGEGKPSLIGRAILPAHLNNRMSAQSCAHLPPGRDPKIPSYPVAGKMPALLNFQDPDLAVLGQGLLGDLEAR